MRVRVSRSVEHFEVWLREPWRIRHGIYPSRIRFGDHVVILLLFLGLFYFFLDQLIHCCEEGWAYAPSCSCFVRGTAPLLNIGPLAMACLAMPSACWSAGVDLQPPRVRLVLPMKPTGNEKNLFFFVYSRCMRPNPRKKEVSSTSARRNPSPHRTRRRRVTYLSYK